ncbi:MULTISPECIES: hypothetical protein [Clostridium]|uniref:Uncharacterized protein n=1 Tax=Clostridium cibarium TaxID=2762247 RepID=A0ABR8PUE6_9CLOT|nr:MULTISPECIES: hypothetical protein [Clostridium]MBD7911801.1 hypothetical protein [Clostridium cibarium]
MIKVQVDELTNDLATLNSAIGDFEPYSDNFAQSAKDSLSGMNSDFISKVKDTLEAMADTKAPELLKKIQEFHEYGLALVETFRETDAKIAENEQLKK